RRGGRPPHAGDRPLLLPVDLLPRAERRAVRDRDDRPGLRRRRAARAPRRAPVASAELRAASRPTRAGPDAAAGYAASACDRRPVAGPPPRAEVRQPRKGAQSHPDRREQDVEEHDRERQGQPPRRPAPERDAAHETSAFAPASARRRSTSLMTRAAVSSIERSEISITGQPSRRWP